ncbi:MAG: TIGR01440 family protein [Bacilli bacterium]
MTDQVHDQDHGGGQFEQIEQIEQSVYAALTELIETAGLQSDQILVVGASSSEIRGFRIGTAGSLAVARAVVTGALRARDHVSCHICFQCCEHLNRALVTERRTLREHRLEEVAAVPMPQAGGAVAAVAYRTLDDAVLVEQVSAAAGIDIGDTFIGMHLRRVAVPVRLRILQIGSAHVTAARTRPKLIGGERAFYQDIGLGDFC